MIAIKSFSVGYLQTNCYVVTFSGQKECAVIDPGGGYERIKEYLKTEDRLATAVLLTHGHFDHIMDARKFQLDGASVFIHQLDAELLEKGGLAKELGIRVPPFSADRKFADGATISAGALTFKAVHTPGHTKGSVCYILGKNIFSGDTLFAESYGRTDFYGGSITDLKSSLNRLFALPGDYTVYPGHMEPTTLSHEREHNPILL